MLESALSILPDMDKPIETEVKRQKRKKTLWIIVTIALAITGAVWLLRSFATTTLERDNIQTAVVERGDVENTLTASGEVLPEFEETITSPMNASIKQVYLSSGSTIKAGQPLLLLDKTASEAEFTKMNFQLESKRNDMRKLKLELDKSYYDIQSSNEVKRLRIASLEADVENAKRLYKAGGGTREDIDKAALELKVAQLEKQQLENDIKNRQQTMQLQLREAAIAASIQQNDLQQLQHKLTQAGMVASRNGVVTWVNRNIGTVIHEGEAVARIADLTGFKIQGSISDIYLKQLYRGQPVIIKVNDSCMRGSIINIQPAIQNNVVIFDVQTTAANNSLLRPNMKVDVYVVTALQKNVLRVANGPAFKGPAAQDIFIVKNGIAQRRSVLLGLSNFDYVELKNQVQPGEVVITSDMSKYKLVRTITITP